MTKTYLPNHFVIKDSFIEVKSPEVQLMELENCIVSGRNSSFVKGNELYIERYLNEDNPNANYRTGGVLFHNDAYAVIVQNSSLNYVEKGFFLAGNGSWNYYHWLIEILPKMKVYLELELYNQDVKLLLSESVKENENLMFLLKSILGDIHVEMIL